jgi:hypothetical protein
LKRVLGPVFLAVIFLSGLLLAGLGQSVVRADDVIGPFIDSQTNAVIHVDFTNLDMDQIAAWHDKAIATLTDPEAKAKAKQSANESIAQSKKWVTDFKNAGGKDLYVVVSLAGMMQGTSAGLVIPLNGADPAPLAKVFEIPNMPKPNPNDPNAAMQARMMPQTAVVGNNLIFSTGAGVEKFKTPSSEPRQDLVDGLTAGGNSTLQLSLTPATLKANPFFKMMAAQMMNAGGAGAAPGGQQKGGPLSEPQWDNVTWLSVSLTSPPKEGATCTIQCKDADSASAMADMINQKIQSYKDDPTKRGDMSADDFNKVAAAIKPSVDGTKVTMNLDADTIDNVLGPMMVKMGTATATVPVKSAPAQPGGGGAAPPADNSGGGM